MPAMAWRITFAASVDTDGGVTDRINSSASRSRSAKIFVKILPEGEGIALGLRVLPESLAGEAQTDRR